MKRFCKTCGAEIGDGTNICSICGSVYGQPQANDTTVLNSNTNYATQTGNETTVLNQNPKFSAPLNNGFGNYSADNRSNISKTSAPNPQLQNPYMQKNFNANNLNGQPFNTQNGANSNHSQYYNPSASQQNGFENGNNCQVHYHSPQSYSQATGYGTVPISSKKKLPVGAIIGIVVGGVVLVGLIAILIAALSGAFQNTTDAVGDYSYSDDENAAREDIVLDYGIISGQSYSNSTLGLHIELPGEDWRFLSDDELFANFAYNNPSFTADGRVYYEAMGDTMYLDMQMTDDQGSSVAVFFYEPLIDDKTEKQVIAANLDMAESDISDDELVSVSICGNEYLMYRCEYMEGLDTILAVRHVGGYYICVMVFSPYNAEVSARNYLDMFY